MSKDDLLNDLDFATALAKEGALTPLLGGRIGLMWGILLFFTFIMQWAILSRTLPLPAISLAFLWIGFATIGGLGSMILGRSIAQRDGANSVANRVEQRIWMLFGLMMFSLFVGIAFNIAFFGGTIALFGLMVAVGFAGQGLAYGVVAHISQMKWLQINAYISFIPSTICFIFYNDILVYLIGGFTSLITIILPSLICMKIERQNG
jgi:hypothetical protein